jgi:D-sedoheptulose 7-phosphate isomerase
MSFAADYFAQVAQLLGGLSTDTMQAMADRLWQAYQEEAQIFTCGNGGSALAATHFVTDLAKGVSLPAGARRFRMVSLVDSLGLLTAYANDVGYEHVFSEPLLNQVRPGDVLLAVSGSGRSPNVLRAMETAKQAGASVLALAGRDGGLMPGAADLCLTAAVENMQQIEDAHLVVLHCLYLELKARAERAAGQ